ncbi:MAG: AAA family ATPase [Selenomonas sp.]|nr:AAA family ATPase [Selenomonas sp.]
MGIYLNPGMDKFQMALDSPIYVDKTGLLSILNQLLRTDQRYVCVSRPRRFGKTMAANMISAYYDRTVQGDRLFLGLEIEQDSSFDMCRNHFDVLRINMQNS